ncbi:MAG: hypothetical protein K8F31_09475 [Roseovarius sp.]|nr:hypothetical protein [Roseovarius sp.]
MSNTRALPVDFTTPAKLAEHFDVSERTVRRRARELGACRIIGKDMILLPEDVETILEASKPCQSKSTSAATSGTTEAQLPEGDFEALRKRLTGKSRNASRTTSNTGRGSVVSMDRGRG